MEEMPTFAHVGECIKARRTALDLTQEALCDRLGWNRRRIGDISQIETGVRANLTVDSLRAFARAMNCSVADLVHGLSIEAAAPAQAS